MVLSFVAISSWLWNLFGYLCNFLCMFEYQNLWSQFWYGFVFDFVENHNGCQCFANFMPNRIPIKKLPFYKYFSKVVCLWSMKFFWASDGIWGFWSGKLDAKKNETSNLQNVVEYCYVPGTWWFSLILKNSLDYIKCK